MSAYFAFGLSGVVAGAALVVALATLSVAPEATALIAVVGPQLGFLIAVKLAHVAAGRERIVLYEVVIPALGVTAAALAAFGQPVAKGLELAVLGIGAAMAFGRIGCLAVGCCHGRPARFGVVYGVRRAARGFPAYLVGVRLFPIQLVESAVHTAITAAGAWLLLRPHLAGEVVALYTALYALARFALELARGDAARPYLAGLSESQWIAAATALGAAMWAAAAGSPARWLYLAVAALLAVASAVLVLLRRRLERGASGARHPRRLRELGEALRALDGAASDAGAPVAVDTGSGLRLTRSLEGEVEHFALSRPGAPLSPAVAAALAARLRVLRKHRGPSELVAGRAAGVFHLYLRR